ncbi:hypothetical protein H0H87_006051 [Tephrocybe sp. NHM501043]|nr:hypothetical protein H0H87_006051 [Tephrocybe sp. NHM501043]
MPPPQMHTTNSMMQPNSYSLASAPLDPARFRPLVPTNSTNTSFLLLPSVTLPGPSHASSVPPITTASLNGASPTPPLTASSITSSNLSAPLKTPTFSLMGFTSRHGGPSESVPPPLVSKVKKKKKPVVAFESLFDIDLQEKEAAASAAAPVVKTEVVETPYNLFIGNPLQSGSSVENPIILDHDDDNKPVVNLSPKASPPPTSSRDAQLIMHSALETNPGGVDMAIDQLEPTQSSTDSVSDVHMTDGTIQIITTTVDLPSGPSQVTEVHDWVPGRWPDTSQTRLPTAAEVSQPVPMALDEPPATANDQFSQQAISTTGGNTNTLPVVQMNATVHSPLLQAARYFTVNDHHPPPKTVPPQPSQQSIVEVLPVESTLKDCGRATDPGQQAQQALVSMIPMASISQIANHPPSSTVNGASTFNDTSIASPTTSNSRVEELAVLLGDQHILKVTSLLLSYMVYYY